MSIDVAWQTIPPPGSRGIIVGSDEHQEWLLPWWWKHYAAINTLPVCFIDFGLSNAALEWCAQRGTVLPLSQTASMLLSKEQTNPLLATQWEATYGNGFWKARPSWFKKPFALLQTPFEKTLWLDLDCEVKADLHPLLSHFSSDLALALEPDYAQEQMLSCGMRLSEEKIYNSGVILYQHDSPAIFDWASHAIYRAALFWSDQHLLSRLLFEKRYPVKELSPHYNWHMKLGHDPDAKIIHWLGDVGKERICLEIF